METSLINKTTKLEVRALRKIEELFIRLSAKRKSVEEEGRQDHLKSKFVHGFGSPRYASFKHFSTSNHLVTHFHYYVFFFFHQQAWLVNIWNIFCLFLILTERYSIVSFIFLFYFFILHFLKDKFWKFNATHPKKKNIFKIYSTTINSDENDIVTDGKKKPCRWLNLKKNYRLITG